MASLHFPSHEALRMALISGLIPVEIAQTTVSASIPLQGGLWLKFAGDLPGEAYASLQRLGAKAFGMHTAKEAQEFPCWAALLPLRPTPAIQNSAEVLFELPSERLSRFLATVERLSCHLASFAILDRTAVVRLIHPPEFLHEPSADVFYPIAMNSWCLPRLLHREPATENIQTRRPDPRQTRTHLAFLSEYQLVLHTKHEFPRCSDTCSTAPIDQQHSAGNSTEVASQAK